MRLPLVRFTVRRMMLLLLLLAFGLFALRFSSGFVADASFLLTLAILSVAILGIAYRRGAGRAFCLGASLWGCGYMALAADFRVDKTEHHPDTQPTDRRSPPFSPQRRPLLVTTAALDLLRPYLQDVRPGILIPLGGDARLAGSYSTTRLVLEKLEEPIPMPFASGTQLKVVIEHIKKFTMSRNFPAGIPIYVDIAGLVEARHTTDASVTIDVQGVPLRVTLGLILKDLDLTFRVENGLLIITHEKVFARDDHDLIHSFRRVGHCCLALLAAVVGGGIGRQLFLTMTSDLAVSPRDPRDPPRDT